MNAREWFYGQPHGFHDIPERPKVAPEPYRPPESAIVERTELNAREGWDNGDTISNNWLADQSDEVMRDVAMRAIAAHCSISDKDDADKAIELLCQRFIADCSRWYRDKAIEELSEGFDRE